MDQRVRYQKPPLTEVVVRLDFVSPFKELSVELPPKVQKVIGSRFPIAEGRDQERVSESDPGWIQRTEWIFHDKQKKRRLVLTPHWLFIDYKNYETFESLKDDFVPVVENLCDAKEGILGRRFGLRYVNRIEGGSGDVTKWGHLLNKDLLGIFRVDAANNNALSRTFHNVVWAFDDMTLNFNFGIHNADFPAPIRAKQFILDFDAFAEGIQELDSVRESLDRFHTKIEDLFEYCITDTMRKKMGIIGD